MVAAFHGQHWQLADLRRRFPQSGKGANLKQLMAYASALGFAGRPLRLEPPDLGKLKRPCILHWDMNHFVVLKQVHGQRAITVLDPAVGQRKLSMAEVSRHFTGVALELAPNADFKPEKTAPRVSLGQLTGKVAGLGPSLLTIGAVALALELFALAAPLLNQWVVDDAIVSQDRELLQVLVLGFGLLLLIQTTLGLARSWMVMLLGQSLSLQWLGNVFAHLVRLPTAYFEQRHLGDVVSRFGAVREIQRTLTTSAVEAVLDGIMAVAAWVMMGLYSLQLSVVVTVAVGAYGLLRWAAWAPLRNASAERLVLAAKEQTHFLETLRAIQPLKLFSREEERRSRWQNLLVDVQNRDVRTAKLSMLFSTGNTFIFGLENLVTLYLGAGLVMKVSNGGELFTIGMLFAFLSYKAQFTGRVAKLIDFVAEFKMLSLHAERLADIALEAPEKDSAPAHDLSHLNPEIELRDVSFRYGEGEPWILRNANFRVGVSENVAITGASGAGKTTLLKIALGLLQPVEGEVLYGGQPLKQIGLQNFRAQIGTVMQDDVLLSGSLADNIAFFDAEADLQRVQTCAQLAQLHEDIARMPMGYQTLVGDLGAGLSGGQKQRLLLARALYKQPRVLALDEATSHLDLGYERAVTAQLARMSLTRIVIAHRPETIAGAQRVVLLKDGQVQDLARQVALCPQ
ncbi:peptidase domain-containing ABC transporter [Pelomonas sp. CA6]|uniref:peptidase domain-containing ABC transporter n=1 Tax=Pelomonas sp. CA6 TaxID=2907999 RepID=UPI001F4BD553|nr:peptidase domain-containing ABC transporter [Pelomonas sp. CA6]